MVGFRRLPHARGWRHYLARLSGYYEILQAGAGSYDPERLRSILVPDVDRFDGGQIASIKLLYDPARYTALGGR